jgi:hydroxymethylbilane synthase
MTRLGVADRITAPLGAPALMHAVGQGALAVEMRSGDAKTRAALAPLGHWPTEWRVGAERGLLRVLEGGCSVPVGVETSLEEITEEVASHYPEDTFEALHASSPTLHFSGLTAAPFTPDGALPPLRARKARLGLTACVTSTDGARHVLYAPAPVVVASYRDAQRWGEDCARQLRTLGAGEILDEINADRKAREAATLAAAVEARDAHQQAQQQAAA